MTLRRPLSALALALSTACASGGRTSPPAAARVQPPQPIGTQTPRWQLPSRPQNGRLLDLEVRVQVDALGQPQLGTLQLRGFGDAANRDAVEQWLRDLRFRPALQDGHAVAGEFRRRFELRVRSEVRSVGRSG